MIYFLNNRELSLQTVTEQIVTTVVWKSQYITHSNCRATHKRYDAFSEGRTKTAC
jgi:hypothetical protein